jgi:hypothetical protein
MPFGTIYESNLSAFFWRDGMFTPPDTAYLALWTVAPTIEGTGGTEVSATGYSRKLITLNDASWSNWSGGQITNAVQVDMSGMTVASGTVVMVTLMDAVTGGNIIALSETVSFTIGINQFARFPIGSLVLKFRD